MRAMMRFGLIGLCVLLWAPMVQAQDFGGDGESPVLATNRADKGGRFGLGFEGTLGGTLGLNARYGLSNDIGLQATVSFGVTSGEAGDPMMPTDFSLVRFGIGLAGQFRLIGWADGALSAFGGVDFALLTSDLSGGANASATVLAFGINGGIHAEWFPADYLSLHGQAGLGLQIQSFNDDDMVPFLGGDRTVTSLNIAGDLYTGFGITFWFG